MKRTILFLLLIAGCASASAQRHAGVTVNFADLACLGTLNLAGEMSLGESLLIEAGARYNNWNFRCDCDSRAFQDRRRTVYAGARKWLSDSCEGIWMTVRLQVEEYNRGGLFSNPATEEGDAFGLAVGAGWSRMLAPEWRFDAGLTAMAGRKKYSRYASPRCGRCLVSGQAGAFIGYDSIIISLTYIIPTHKQNNR